MLTGELDAAYDSLWRNDENCQMIDLDELANGLPAISPVWGRTLAEIAGVCLESQGHAPGIWLLTIGCSADGAQLFWTNVANQTRRSWADLQEATEYGATAVAIMLAKRETGYAVIERAMKGTGIDYWLGDDFGALPFQRKARLEISGILHARGDSRAVKRAVAARVEQKLEQTVRSGNLLPAYAVVVEFGTPLAEVRKR